MNKAKTVEDNPSIKEIAEDFSAVKGQEISKEEVNLIQDIQLLGKMEEVTEGEDTTVTDQDEA